MNATRTSLAFAAISSLAVTGVMATGASSYATDSGTTSTSVSQNEVKFTKRALKNDRPGVTIELGRKARLFVGLPASDVEPDSRLLVAGTNSRRFKVPVPDGSTVRYSIVAKFVKSDRVIGKTTYAWPNWKSMASSCDARTPGVVVQASSVKSVRVYAKKGDLTQKFTLEPLNSVAEGEYAYTYQNGSKLPRGFKAIKMVSESDGFKSISCY